MVLRWDSARMWKALGLIIPRVLLARAEWMVECLLLALSGHLSRPAECPLSGVKWTLIRAKADVADCPLSGRWLPEPSRPLAMCWFEP
jgi:hypothetical protein